MEIPKSQFLKLKLRRLLKNTAVGNKHEGPSFPFRLFQRSAQHWTRPLHIFSGGYYIRGRFEMQLEKLLEKYTRLRAFFRQNAAASGKKPANRQAALPPAALAARDDVGQREAAQIRLDYLVEPLPQPERPAGVRLLALAAVVNALYRCERALG